LPPAAVPLHPKMQIKTEVSIDVARGREEVFAFAATTENLTKFFPGKGPIPGITGASLVGGGEVKAGTVRHVQMTDGSELDETFIEFTRPSGYAYQMSRLRPPLSYLVTVAEGRWIYTGDASSTHIVWQYCCTLTSPLAAPIAALVVKGFMKSAMADALKLIKTHCEAAKTP